MKTTKTIIMMICKNVSYETYLPIYHQDANINNNNKNHQPQLEHGNQSNNRKEKINTPIYYM